MIVANVYLEGTYSEIYPHITSDSEGLRRSGYPQAGPLEDWCQGMLAKHREYTREHLEDMPEIRDWLWTEGPSCVSRRFAEPRGSPIRR